MTSSTNIGTYFKHVSFSDMVNRKDEAIRNYLHWQANARRQESYIYYTGHCLSDNIISLELKKLVMKMSEQGLVYLVRKRVENSHNKWNFIAIRAGNLKHSKLIPLTVEERNKRDGNRNNGWHYKPYEGVKNGEGEREHRISESGDKFNPTDGASAIISTGECQSNDRHGELGEGRLQDPENKTTPAN